MVNRTIILCFIALIAFVINTEVEAQEIEVQRDNERQPESRTFQKLFSGHYNLTSAANLSPRRKRSSDFVCDCCITYHSYQTLYDVRIHNTTYKVIGLDGKRQFFITEKCPQNHSCPFGACVQEFAYHQVLIWNDSKPVFPPFDFVDFFMPSRCRWSNESINF